MRYAAAIKVSLAEVSDLLARTPRLLDAWLRGLPDAWARQHEGPDTWSPFDVVGHLIHGEDTDWIPRLERILAHGEERPFEPFDRFAMLTRSRGKTLGQLLDEFATKRAQSLATLAAKGLGPADLARKGRHPELGQVTLGQLLATWVAHDQGHIAQIARVLAKGYRDEVGPWRAYLRVLA